MLDELQTMYLDRTLPAPERLCAMTLTAQLLGVPVNLLVPGPNVWKDGLIRLRYMVNAKSKEFKRDAKKNNHHDTKKALERIRKLQNELD